MSILGIKLEISKGNLGELVKSNPTPNANLWRLCDKPTETLDWLAFFCSCVTERKRE